MTEQVAEAPKEELVRTCSIQNVEALSKETPNGIMLIVTQPSCGYCEPMLKEATKAIGEKVAIVEANLDDVDCNRLAKQLNVPGTPIAVYFKDGKEKGRRDPSGKTWDQIRNAMTEMVAKEAAVSEEDAAKAAGAEDSQPAPETSPDV